MKIYMAPMEGITDFTFRNKFDKYYGGVDKYFTPFLSPRSTEAFTSKEMKDINPLNNAGKYVVPQYLTCVPEHFIWAMNDAYRAGYTEVNLNLGCPSGTVTAKKKGSGFLQYPDELDAFFDKVFSNELADKMQISVKTRLSYSNPEEFYRILDIFNKYPISEMIVHPRVKTDLYDLPVRMEYYDYAVKNAKMPVIYNGEIRTVADAEGICEKYPATEAVMIGRGLLPAPWLALSLKGNRSKDADIETFKAFHSELFSEYRDRLPGQAPLVARYKEFWFHFLPAFALADKYGKDLKKARNLADTEFLIGRILSGGFKR